MSNIQLKITETLNAEIVDSYEVFLDNLEQAKGYARAKRQQAFSSLLIQGKDIFGADVNLSKCEFNLVWTDEEHVFLIGDSLAKLKGE